MDRRRRGAVAAGAVLAGYLAACALLAWASAGGPAAVRAPGPVALDAALGLVAAAAAWLVLTWTAVTTLLALAGAALTGTMSLPRLERLAERVTPTLARRAAVALLGTGLAGASLAGGSVHGGSPAYAESSPPAAAAGFVPGLDRPADVLPGWTPDRPARPPSRRPPSRVHLVTTTGSAGRSVADEVVVRRGDTLWDIAARYLGPDATPAEVATEWPRWHRTNRHLIGPEPDLILPGQRLRPPRR